MDDNRMEYLTRLCDEKDARIAELEGHIRGLNSLVESCNNTITAGEKVAIEYMKVRKESARLRTALVKYGEHYENCDDYRFHTGNCDCGFSAALSPTQHKQPYTTTPPTPPPDGAA